MKFQTMAWVFVAALVPAAGAQFSGFQWGVFATGDEPADTPHVLVSGDLVHVDGLDNVFCGDSHVWVQMIAPVDGHVSFTAQFTNSGGGLLNNAPVAYLDGSFTTPPGSSWPSGDYVFAFDVTAGQRVGFGVSGTGCVSAPGMVDVSDFSFVPRTWFAAGGSIDPRLWLDIAPPPAAAGFGDTLGAFGDLNGDGIGDLAVGAPARGHAFVVSGADGSVLLDVMVSPATGMQVNSAGDFNADGAPDLLVGLPHASVSAPDAGRIEVYSGLDGSLLAAYDGMDAGWLLGSSVAPAGDTDGDGFADIIAGAPADPHTAVTGYTVILGGPGATLLHRDDGSQGFGIAVTGMGDADFDGLPDVAMATAGSEARVEVHSGKGRGVISVAESSFLAWNASLAPVADLDGDGAADYAWGLPTTHQEVPHEAYESGRVWIRSGATGAVLHEWAGSNPWDVIGDVVTTGDWNSDGRTDVAFASFVGDESGYAISRRVRIHSGAPGGELLHELVATGADDFGAALATPGDLDGDSVADLAIGAPGGTIGVRCVHALAGNGTPQLAGQGELIPGGAFSLLLTQGKARAPVMLVAGASQVNLPLKGGLLVPSDDLLIPMMAGPDGSVSLTARWVTGIPGPFMFWVQFWTLDSDAAHGFSASNGLGALQH